MMFGLHITITTILGFIATLDCNYVTKFIDV